MEKYRDDQRELHCVFVDLEKAYDRVTREELWYCMRKSGVAEKYVRVVQDMYERSRTVLRCAVGQTEEFKVEVGLHQGSALSPFLFAIVMHQLSEEVRQESPWTMMFADDIVICSESREQVEESLDRWRFALERRGLKVSRSKTEYMCVNEREGSGTVRLQGEEVKKVQEFKYLGSTVQSNGECGKELLKFADNTIVIGLIQDGDESAYKQVVEQLAAWCSLNNLELNMLKTVEMIVDFRRNTPALPPLTIMNSTVPRVESFRFLGTTIFQDLKWDTHIDSIVKKAQRRLYFLWQLRKFNLPQELLTQFYSAMIERGHPSFSGAPEPPETPLEPMQLGVTSLPGQEGSGLARNMAPHTSGLFLLAILRWVVIFLDSGAAGYSTDKKMAHRLGLPLESMSHPLPVSTLDGWPLVSGLVVSLTAPLTLHIVDHTERITLYVTDVPELSLILEFPWLQLNNPQIDWSTGSIFVFGPLMPSKLPQGFQTLPSTTEESMDPTRVWAVKDWPQPTSLHAVQRFLDFAIFFHRFMKNFSTLASPLHALTRRAQGIFIWTGEAQEVFKALKENLLQPLFFGGPILVTGVGVILSQCSGPEGELHPCAADALSRQWHPPSQDPSL
ncbi:hypothetical protein QTP86_005503 [Hemibagrus guttatus]|nr:hypothetical protein QTP86_005503 [Hemibagrus guttatus]